MFQEELFVEIPGYEHYVVSNYGRVVNTKYGWDLKPCPDSRGVNRVVLQRDGKRTEWYIHRLVAQAFFLNYDDDREVEFINGNADDCTVLNLTLGAMGLKSRKRADRKEVFIGR